MDRAIRFFVLLVVGVMFIGGAAEASPVFGETYQFTQPDGSEVPVVLFGDEFYMRMETPDGYTVVQDPDTGWFCYAELSSDGMSLISSGEHYVASGGLRRQAVPMTREKGLALPAERVKELVDEARQAYSMDAYNDIALEPVRALSSQLDAPLAEPLPPRASSADLAYFNTAVTGLVMIIEFSDYPAAYSLAEYEAAMNATNAHFSSGNASSLRTYYNDVSRGALDLTSVVVGPIRVSKTFAEYTADTYSGNAPKDVLREGLQYLEDTGFDFSQLSLDPSGRIKCCSFMHTGPASPRKLWYHSHVITSSTGKTVYGGYTFYRYCFGNARTLDPLIMIHEYGHMLAKWPDLYGQNYSTGIPGIMSSYFVRLPAPYLMYRNGWLDAVNVKGSTGTFSLDTTDAHNAYVYYDDTHPTEYFFLYPYDKDLLYCRSLLDEGLTVWRINTEGNNYKNDPPTIPLMVDLIKADGGTDFYTGVCFRQGGALDHFDPYTLPASLWLYNGRESEESGLRIMNVSPGGGSNIVFDLSADPVPPKETITPGNQTLFADTFERFASEDIDARGDGMSGTLYSAEPVTLYYEGYEGSGTADSTEIIGNRLRMAVGNGMSENGLTHNFIDQSIIDAGGFSVQMDVTEINSAATDLPNRYAGFGVGLTQSEAETGGDISNIASFRGRSTGTPVVGRADYFVEIDKEQNVKVWRYGSLVGTYAVGAETGTLRVDFACSGFSTANTVTATAYFNGSPLGSPVVFNWQHADSNYIGLSARASNYAEMDSLKISSLGQDGDLLSDTFDRIDMTDIDSNLTGAEGSLVSGGLLRPGGVYFEGYEPYTKTSVIGNRKLRLADLGGIGESGIMHNFIDQDIIDAGGFSVSVQIDEMVFTSNPAQFTPNPNYYMGFGVGLTKAEAQTGASQYSTNAPYPFRGYIAYTNGIADCFIELDSAGDVKVLKNGEVVASVPVGVTNGTLTAAFACDGFTTTNIVEVSVFFNGQLLDINPADTNRVTQTFVWDHDNANYLGLSARASYEVILDYLAIRTLPLGDGLFEEAALLAGLFGSDADPAADADGDGESNWLEWLKGTDMAVSNAPAKSIELGSVLGDTITFNQRRVAGAEQAGLSYPIEYSTNLVDWMPASTVELNVTPVSGGTHNDIEMKIDESITTGKDHLFIRGIVAP